jgi:hypothetical protein
MIMYKVYLINLTIKCYIILTKLEIQVGEEQSMLNFFPSPVPKEIIANAVFLKYPQDYW